MVRIGNAEAITAEPAVGEAPLWIRNWAQMEGENQHPSTTWGEDQHQYGERNKERGCAAVGCIRPSCDMPTDPDNIYDGEV
jgi:hypothetical protein